MIVGIFSNSTPNWTAREINEFLQEHHVTRPDQLVRLDFRIEESGRYTVLVAVIPGPEEVDGETGAPE